MRTSSLILALVATSLLFVGCSKKIKEKNSTSTLATVITVTQPQRHMVEVLEETVGSLESIADPTIVAEVPGRIEKIFVHPGDTVTKGQIMATLDSHDLSLSKQSSIADVKRLQTLLANQQRTTNRYRDLLKDKYVSQSNLEEAISQEAVLNQQLSAAKAQLELTTRSVDKTRLYAPVNARVESQLVSEGGFVKAGDPVFQIVTTSILRAHLPFPESTAPILKPGTRVRMSTPTSPNDIIEGMIKEIKPMTGANRSLDAIVEIENKGTWKPGSSVTAQVIVVNRANAVMVPEQSVVLRPAGAVVYTIHDNIATQKIVQTGVSHGGMIEIISGLSDNETIAVDGAGFLSDRAQVKTQKG